MIAGIYNGRVYITLDYGATWNEMRPSGDVDITLEDVKFSADGSRIFMSLGNSLYVGTFLP
jgi:photosystem II stability/assembly factor-like uncharacterized protein